MLIITFSCKSNKNEYIELTTGLSMDPFQSRMGVIINSNDSIYFCKEVIDMTNNNEAKPTIYRYYVGKEKINFNEYKKDVKLLFSDTIIFDMPKDAKIEKLEFSIDGKLYKRFLTYSILSKKQSEFIHNLKYLMTKGNFVEIPYHKFSRDLLYYKIPYPPQSR